MGFNSGFKGLIYLFSDQIFDAVFGTANLPVAVGQSSCWREKQAGSLGLIFLTPIYLHFSCALYNYLYSSFRPF